MAGDYEYVTLRPSDPDEGTPGFVEGKTHGCGCCSDYRTLTKVDLESHIHQLKEDLATAEELLKFFDQGAS